MKKFLVWILALIMIVSMIACTNKPAENVEIDPEDTVTVESDTVEESSEDETTAPFVPSPEADFDEDEVFPDEKTEPSDEETKPSNEETHEEDELKDALSSSEDDDFSSDDLKDSFENYKEEQNKKKNENTESESAD